MSAVAHSRADRSPSPQRRPAPAARIGPGEAGSDDRAVWLRLVRHSGCSGAPRQLRLCVADPGFARGSFTMELGLVAGRARPTGPGILGLARSGTGRARVGTAGD